jgi:hypothetical protein
LIAHATFEKRLTLSEVEGRGAAASLLIAANEFMVRLRLRIQFLP